MPQTLVLWHRWLGSDAAHTLSAQALEEWLNFARHQLSSVEGAEDLGEIGGQFSFSFPEEQADTLVNAALRLLIRAREIHPALRIAFGLGRGQLTHTDARIIGSAIERAQLLASEALDGELMADGYSAALFPASKRPARLHKNRVRLRPACAETGAPRRTPIPQSQENFALLTAKDSLHAAQDALTRRDFRTFDAEMQRCSLSGHPLKLAERLHTLAAVLRPTPSDESTPLPLVRKRPIQQSIACSLLAIYQREPMHGLRHALTALGHCRRQGDSSGEAAARLTTAACLRALRHPELADTLTND